MHVEKVTLILHTNVTHEIKDSNNTSHAWMVQSQHMNMTYKVPLPFNKYVCYTYEWVLRGNLCKHQVIVVTYEIRVFFEGAQKEVFSSIFLKAL
jgi:hypothetical protein